jgi:hypothetical protein
MLRASSARAFSASAWRAGEQPVELVRIEPELLAGGDRCSAWVGDVSWIRVDRDRGRAERERGPGAVVDRPPVRRDFERLAMLAGGEPVERARPDRLEPAGPRQRERKDEGEHRDEKADAPVRDPQRHPATAWAA